MLVSNIENAHGAKKSTKTWLDQTKRSMLECVLFEFMRSLNIFGFLYTENNFRKCRKANCLSTMNLKYNILKTKINNIGNQKHRDK